MKSTGKKKTKEAFGSIASYNGHEEWLWNMADEMANCDSFYSCGLPTEEWYTDKHALWMSLVGLFGDWGTSIRCGWIEDKEAAIAFINSATERFGDEMGGE